MNNLCAKDHVLEWKTLPNKEFDCSDIRSINLFIDNDNNIFVLTDEFLYINNDWTKVDKYGRLLNGFLKDSQFYMALEKDGNIDVYNVKKDFRLTSRIKIIDGPNALWSGVKFEKIFALPGKDDSYFLQGDCPKLPTNPIELIFLFTSGGHGIIYKKPFLAEVQDGKMLRYLKFRYRGKLDESFYIEEASGGENSISFLGFRRLEEPAFGPNKYPPQPIILHYTDYDLKKKKVTRSHNIHEEIDRFDAYKFGFLSMTSKDNTTFMVYSLYKFPHPRKHSAIDYIKQNLVESNIYYFQYSNKSTGDTIPIAEGFLPLVKVDPTGNVYVFWVDYKGQLLMKRNKNHEWSDETIILTGIDVLPTIYFFKYVSVEFGKDDNLNVIFPSNGNLVYTKIKPY